jgi:N-acetylneuraminic acid mutarotase
MKTAFRKILGVAGIICGAAARASEPGNPAAAWGTAPSLHWSKAAPLPEARSGYASGVIDGRVVIAGGSFWKGTKGHWIKKEFSASTHAFDPKSNTWERLPDAPIPFGYAASATVDNQLYVIGGYTGREVNRKVFALKKGKGGYAWTAVGPLPADRLFSGCESVGSSIYLVGGTTEFEPFDLSGTCCTSRTATNTVLAFDAVHPDRGWRRLAPFPGAKRWSFSTATDGRFIWMFGGADQDDAKGPIRTFDEVLRYDTVSDSWKPNGPLPDGGRGATPLTPVFVRGRILLMSFGKKVWQFDPAALDYRELTPLPEEAAVDRFFWLDGRIIGSGGENKLEGPRRRSEWTFSGRFEP